MKAKKIVLGSFLGLVIGLGLTACGSDDKPPVAPPAKAPMEAGEVGDVVTPQYDNPNAEINGADPVEVKPIDGEPSEGLTSMKFTEYSHDFGNVGKGSENTHVFKFTNTGEAPLNITNARSTCGCTVPEWPKEPILPGEGGEIKVVFKPKDNQAGQSVTKPVTISANIEGGSQQLQITAEVAK